MVVDSAIDGSWTSKVNNFRSKKMGTLIDLTSLPEASKHGDDTAIMIPDELMDNSLDEWKFSLIGRLDFQKLKIELADKVLKDQWKLKGSSQSIPLGKGFFVIKLDNENDQKRIRNGGLWQVENQFLKIREWEPNFKPENQKSSTAFVWALFPGLCIEYWKEEIILSIGKTIGRPIQVDETTLKREIGYYASVMVEVDLTKEIPDRIWIGSKYGGFYQSIKIPKLPKFCEHCKSVGHIVSECRVNRNDLNKPEEGEIVEENIKFRKKGKNKDKEERTFAGSSGSKDDQVIVNMTVVDCTPPVTNEAGIKLSETFHALNDMEDDGSIKDMPMELCKVPDNVSSAPSSINGVSDNEETLATYQKRKLKKGKAGITGKASKQGVVNPQSSIMTTRKQSLNKLQGAGEREQVATSQVPSDSEVSISKPSSSAPVPGSIRSVSSKAKATGLFPNGALDSKSKGMSISIKDPNKISATGLIESLSVMGFSFPSSKEDRQEMFKNLADNHKEISIVEG